MQQIEGRWALVTGASRGIGEQIALGLSGLRCNLVLHSRSLEHTESLAERLRAEGIDVQCLAAELSDPAEVERLVTEIHALAFDIDILYSNAAIMESWEDDVWSIPVEKYQRSFQINVLSQIALCDAIIPGMIERGWGRVVNLVSDIDQQPQLAPYAITKKAFEKYTLDMKPILAGTGVTMNALDPGWLKTDMGSQEAPNNVESVVPGVLLPVMSADDVSGRVVRAQRYTGLSKEAALTESAE